jgi:hypothetical protein
MDTPMLNALTEYFDEWFPEFSPLHPDCRDRDWDEFSTEPLKNKIFEEIGNDEFGQNALGIFFQHNFVELLEYWEENNANMLFENSEKFKDLLIRLAPVINLNESDKQYVQRIVNIAGDAKSVFHYVPKSWQSAQFCYETFFCVMVDEMKNKERNTRLFLACKSRCSDIAAVSDWPLKANELVFLENAGYYEDFSGGSRCLWKFARDWGISLRSIKQ